MWFIAYSWKTGGGLNSYFGNWFWKTTGKSSLDFRWAISLGKSNFSIKIALPQMGFKSPAILLNAWSEQPVRSLPCIFPLSGAGLLTFSNQISPHEEKISGYPPRFAVGLCTQGILVLWLFAKDVALLKRFFCDGTTRLSQDRKQFITTEPTRIHTRDGRTHNGNLRYTIRPIEDAIHYFHERQGLRH